LASDEPFFVIGLLFKAMSGMALIWAANVKGLKPAAKIVLIQLADFHNKETGQ